MGSRNRLNLSEQEIVKLNELYLAGLTVAEISEKVGINEGQAYEVIRKQRAKNPDKWPARKRRSKKDAWVIRKPKTILQATFPRLQPRSSLPGPVVTRQMTVEECLKYGVYIPPRNSNGEVIKPPVQHKIPSN